ncbi:hypothetical protein PG987_014064 [Apiospora arundinis]
MPKGIEESAYTRSLKTNISVTYDHILLNTRDPVRSPIYKQQRAELVLGSVTTWESSVLYVLVFLIFISSFCLSEWLQHYFGISYEVNSVKT